MTNEEKDAAIREAAATTQPEVFLAVAHKLYVVSGETLARYEYQQGELAQLRQARSVTVPDFGQQYSTRGAPIRRTTSRP